MKAACETNWSSESPGSKKNYGEEHGEENAGRNGNVAVPLIIRLQIAPSHACDASIQTQNAANNHLLVMTHNGQTSIMCDTTPRQGVPQTISLIVDSKSIGASGLVWSPLVSNRSWSAAAVAQQRPQTISDCRRLKAGKLMPFLL
jgi:hypothetical protein